MLKTGNSKNVVVARSESHLDERLVTANTSSLKSGQYGTFVWDIGDSERHHIQLRHVKFDYEAKINASNVGSSYHVWLPWSLIEYIEVLVNDVQIYETKPALDEGRFYVQSLQEREKSYEHFIHRLGNDMSNHVTAGADYWHPDEATNGNWSDLISASDATATSTGYFQSASMSQFFYGILHNLAPHRIRKLEFRFRMTAATGTELTKRLSVTAAGADIGNEHNLYEFLNPRIRITYERFMNPQADNVGASIPLVLYSKRREVKRYTAPFTGSATFRFNLRQDFSYNSLIDKVYFLRIPNPADPRNAVPLTNWRGIKVYLNGEEKEAYNNTSAIKRYLNIKLENEYGHLLYKSNTATSAFSDYRAFIPYVQLSSIHDPVGIAADKVLLITGKSNQQDTHEIELTADGTNVDDLYVIVESPIVAEVYANGNIKVTGK